MLFKNWDDSPIKEYRKMLRDQQVKYKLIIRPAKQEFESNLAKCSKASKNIA